MWRRLIFGAALVVCLGGCGRSRTEARRAAATERCIAHYAKTATEPNHFEATYEERHVTEVSWEGPVYPPLPKRELNYEGSGVASYSYRYRVDGAAWSPWRKSSRREPAFNVNHTKNGERFTVEVRTIDVKGHVHGPVKAHVTSGPPLRVGEVGRTGEECSEARGLTEE